MRGVLLVILLTACGGEPDCFFGAKKNAPKPRFPCTVAQVGGVIDPEVLPIVSSFSADAAAREIPCLHTPIVGFIEKPLPEDRNILGYCTYTIDVILVREYWNWLTPESRRTLIYHELGHCALLRPHTDPNAIDIMNPYLLSDSVAIPQWDRLVNKLFTGKEEG
jgi:hypothetical protein